MFLIKLICITLLFTAINAEDNWFSKTLDAAGSNVVTLCLRQGQKCDGTILAENWVLVTASCVFPKPFEEILILRQKDVNCDEYNALSKEFTARRANFIYNHPQWYRHSSDVALIALDKPYFDQEPYPNFEGNVELKRFENWIKQVINSYTELQMKHQKAYMPRALENPIKTFIFAILFPTVAFFIFFIYFIFFTGNTVSCNIRRQTNNDFNYEKLEVSN